MGTKLKLSGADMLMRALHDEGVDLIFGYPGGAALHIYDALFRQDKIEHILVRHEQGATHAADGYARATGKPGVVLVTSGPGATNAITGIATAFMDSIPMVVISGQVASNLIGTDAFQETDMIGISRPVVKHSYTVFDASEIPKIVQEAFHVATSGRPGPVVIDIPKDMKDADQVSVNVWICNGQVLRLVLNPFTPSYLPYYAVPYEVNPYSFFGVGIAENMDDTQTLMNGFMRMAVDNAALSGNLIIEVDETNLVPGQDLSVYP